MNVYDFDGTIYTGDSMCHFVRWLWRKYPRTLLNLPRTVWYGLLYKMKLVSKEWFKMNLYRMFSYVEDMDRAVAEFTDEYIAHIKPWYIQQQRYDDVVVTASPEFLVKSFCRKLGIQYCIGSKVDMYKGILKSEICAGEMKVDRFYSRMYYSKENPGDNPNGYRPSTVNKFYSDRLSDEPMARIAKCAYLVKGDTITDWPKIKLPYQNSTTPD